MVDQSLHKITSLPLCHSEQNPIQMSPSAAVAIPQYTKVHSQKLTDADLYNMDSSLDFDLLAEYLLEDLGASGSGFDFR